MGDVAALRGLHTPQERVKYLLSLVPKDRAYSIRDEAVRRGELLRITNMRQALAYGDAWQRACEEEYTLLQESERLLARANAELERLRRLTA